MRERATMVRLTAATGFEPGLFLHDHLGGRALLPPCASIDLRGRAGGRPLKTR